MDLETTFIKRTKSYLMIRDIFLVFLVSCHVLAYIRSSALGAVVSYIAVIIGLALVLYYIKLIRISLKARNDHYLGEAFKDEFFVNMKVKAGFHGFLAGMTACIAVIIATLALQLLSISVSIPAYFIGEAILLAGVITYDISLVSSSRG